MKKVEKVEKIKKEKKPLKNKLYLFLTIVLLAVIIFLGYSYYNLQKTIKTITDPKIAQKYIQEQTQELIGKLSKHIILPSDEEPTMAIITDVDALKKEQPFYNGCENGDQILVYKKAKIGIVYRPSNDVIVKVGPLVVESENAKGTEPSTKDDSYNDGY